MPAHQADTIQELLTTAQNHAAKYEWKTAAEVYEEAQSHLGSKADPNQISQIQELRADALYRAAFQAEDREEFKKRMKQAESAYQHLKTTYEEIGSEASSRKAEARHLFASYWITDQMNERREFLSKLIPLAEDAAKIFESKGDSDRLLQTHSDLELYLHEAGLLANKPGLLAEYYQRALVVSESAIAESERLNKDEELLQALNARLWLLALLANYVLEPEEALGQKNKANELATRILKVAERIGTPNALSLAKEATGWVNAHFLGNMEKADNIFEEDRENAESTGDSQLIGRAATWQTYSAIWKALGQEDVETIRAVLQKAVDSASRAIQALGIHLDSVLQGFAYVWYSEAFISSARFVDTDLEKKKSQTLRAIEIARSGMASEQTWLPHPRHTLSKALYFHALKENDLERKQSLLKEALEVRQKDMAWIDYIQGEYWDRGVERNYLALIKAELSTLASGQEGKLALLKEAVHDMQECVELCSKWSTPAYESALADYEEWYGDILQQIYDFTRDPEAARRAISEYDKTNDLLTRMNHFLTRAAINWKIGRIYDASGEYKRASTTFKRAAEDYRLGAERSPTISGALQELALYMDAWVEIQEARISHQEQLYHEATEHYNKAAEILSRTKGWNYLSNHYHACSFLEEGEASSRKDKQNEAIEHFSKAAELLSTTEELLNGRIKTSPIGPEQHELETWLKITKGRRSYSLGRVDLEKAKTIDKSGDKVASAKHYNSAAKIFKALLLESESEQVSKELETLTLFCEAWAKMKEAETESSPEIFIEAAELFAKSKEAAPGEKLRPLTLANSSICRALEAGTRFRLTRDPQLYSEIKRYLATAADYYGESGYENAADWTRATQRFFDALVYSANAETEVDRRKKSELYQLAEKHLQLAGKLYDRAGYQGKAEETLRHLKGIQEEKEILLTPIEVLSESPPASASTLTTISFTRDQALGLERFEEANVIGSLIAPDKEVRVGSDFSYELEIANTGRTAATLIKLENLVPDGFEVDRTKNEHRIEEGFINLKGKRLEYMKTHEAKIVLKAHRKGTYPLKPRILFADESGNYKSYDFDTAELTVSELGISKWVRGSK